MKRFVQYVCLLVFVAFGFGTQAQVATSVNPSGFGDRQFAMDTVYSNKRIREDDKMYQISVWRRIDLREKYNLSLYGSGDNKSNGIVNHIYKAVVDENALEVEDEVDGATEILVENQTHYTKEQIIENHNVFLESLRHRFLDEKRKEALRKFENLGFPTKKDEEYKYTNLKEITEKAYNFFPKENHNITKEQLDELHLGEENFDWITFVNGKLHKELSKVSIENVEFLSFNYALNDEKHREVFDMYFNTIASKDSAFTNLNEAYCKYGFFLKVPKNVVIERPIHIFYISQNQEENTFYNTRNLLIVEEGAKVEIIESHHNFDNTYVLTNSVTEIFTYSNAKADWHKLQNDNDTSYLIDSTFARQEKDSLTTVNTFSFGGKLVRNNLDFIHNGSNINSFMNGITIIGKDQLVDHHTAVHHNFPNCESYQNYKGIFDGKSHGVFNG